MLSRAIAEHVARVSFDDLPAPTVAAAKRALLDGLGVMLGASGSSEAAPFVALAEQRRREEGGAIVLGHGFRADPAAAALANGAMAHVLDYEDAFDAAPCHPNASLLPAALAVATARPDVGGRALLAAIAVGCDLVCRLALSLRRPMELGGWYPPPILGAFGAAAAAGKLMRLEPVQLLDAFSLVLAQNSCPGEIKYSPDSVMRAIREAFPAQAAVTCAELAARGVRGFDAPFEGKAGFFRLFVDGDYDEAALLDGLGEHYWIEQLTFKRWPSCRGTHAYIEAVETLRRRGPLEADSVARVTLRGGEIQRMLAEPIAAKRRPSSAIEAKFSLPFTVAAAIVDGTVDLDSFTANRLADSRLLAVADRIAFEEDESWGRARPAAGEIELQLTDGRILTERIEIAEGHPDRPLGDDRLHAKFADCAARAARPVAITAAQAAAWIEAVTLSPSIDAWLAL